MKEHMDVVTNPQVAVPVVSTVSFFSWFADTLPLMINIVGLIYGLMLIADKGWKMYKEWKGKNEPKE